MDITTLTTEQLCELVKASDFSTFSAEDIGGELLYRLIPTDDVAGTTEYRGGVRPTHAPSH